MPGTPSSDGRPTASRVVATLVAGVLAALGVLLVVSALASSDPEVRDSRWFLVALGVAVLGTAAVVVVLRVASPGGSISSDDTRGRLRVPLSPRTPLTMVLLGTTFALLLVVAVLAVGIGDGGLLFLPLVLLFAALVPDALRGLLRKPGLVLTADGVSYRGWTVDSRLAWEDVVSVDLDVTEPRRPRLLVAGRPDAPSWEVSSHRLLLPLDRVPSAPRIVVLAGALDHPTRVEVLVRRLAASAAADRPGLLGPDGVAFLSGAR